MKRLFAFTTSVTPFFLRKLRKQVKANSPICLHRTLLEIKTLAIPLHLLPSLAFARNKLEINEKGVLAEAKRQKQKNKEYALKNDEAHLLFHHLFQISIGPIFSCYRRPVISTFFIPLPRLKKPF